MILLAWMALAAMSDAQIATARKAAPADVRAVVDRWEMCNHWGGEEPYDKARAPDRTRLGQAALRPPRCR
jgi:hypothetical protein